jgi:hypothetical protein
MGDYAMILTRLVLKEEYSMSIKRSSPQIQLGSMLASVLVMVMLLSSCILPGPVVPATATPLQPTAIQLLPATATAGSSNPTAAPQPSDTPQPSNTPFPTFTNTPIVNQPAATSAGGGTAAGVIGFSTGTTAGVVQSTVQAGQVLTYTVSASQGQAMVLILASANSSATLALYDPNGLMLVDPANKWIRYQTVLPKTGVYSVQVRGGASAVSFTLTAKISQVVNFALGTSSITLSGTTLKGYLFSYSFQALANQTLTASLNVPASTATIDVFGINSGSLLSPASHATNWTGTLPRNDVYVIEVIPTGGQVISYSLTVSITGGTSGGSTPAGSIAFAAGTTMGTVSGSIAAGQLITYTINAGAGVPMILDVTSPATDVYLGLIQPNGTLLLGTASHWIHWQGMLPQSGIYTIQLLGGAAADTYSLSAKIPVRVNFASGTSSIGLTSTTVNGLPFSYVFRCGLNQNMIVSLNVPATTAYLSISGLSSGYLLNPATQANTWTGVLPATDEYIIEVIPVGGGVVNFILSVSVY